MDICTETPGTTAFRMEVLGAVIDHLGSALYRTRPPAIIELVANAWDAGAKKVSITAVTDRGLDPAERYIEVHDNGTGMNDDEIQSCYLPIARNRRRDSADVVNDRKVMGQKGLGKLAALGVANDMTVTTWKEGAGYARRLTINYDNVVREDVSIRDIEIPGESIPVPIEDCPSGTIIRLTNLKHPSPLNETELHQALARKFTRHVKSEMSIEINGHPLAPLDLKLDYRFPPEEGEFQEIAISQGQTVKYWYGFSSKTLREPALQGFVIYARERAAQSSPFFFKVESTASGQHSTRYVIGEVHADYLDETNDRHQNVILTNRQEIDWDHERTQDLLAWGDKLARKTLKECADRMKETRVANLLEDEGLKRRLSDLDKHSQKMATRFLKTLSAADSDHANLLEMASIILQAFEYSQFYDFIDELNQFADDPEGLSKVVQAMRRWQTIESRAILGIIKCRIDIIDRMETMIHAGAPERKRSAGQDDFHDLIAGYPWLLHPDWQIMYEEKSLTTTIRKLEQEVLGEDIYEGRYDFLAMSMDSRLYVIDIKRPDYSPKLDELLRLVKYRESLKKAWEGEIVMVLVCGMDPEVSEQELHNWNTRDDAIVLKWSEIFGRAKRHYQRYQGTLEDISSKDFHLAQKEVAQSRRVLDKGTIARERADRLDGLGVAAYDTEKVVLEQPRRDTGVEEDRADV